MQCLLVFGGHVPLVEFLLHGTCLNARGDCGATSGITLIASAHRTRCHSRPQASLRCPWTREAPFARGRTIRHRTIHHRPWRTPWPLPPPPPPASFPNSLARRMAFGAGPILRPGRPLPLPVPATELICVAFRWCPSSSSIHHDPADFSRVPSDHDSNVGTPERGFRPHLIRL